MFVRPAPAGEGRPGRPAGKPLLEHRGRTAPREPRTRRHTACMPVAH